MDLVTYKKVMFGIGALLSFLIAIPSTQAAWAPDPDFGLGDAGQFAVLSLGKPTAETLGQSKLDISSVLIFGDVGVGPFGVLDSQGPSIIYGNLYIDPTLLPQDILSDVGTVTGETIYTDSLAGAVEEAINASDDLAALDPTQTFDRLLSSTTIYGSGNGEMNVIAIDGIDYARSNPTTPLVLNLVGGDTDLFVLNVNGKFVLGPHARILSPDPSQLLINVLDGKVPVQFASDSLIEGTLLATSRKMGPLQGTSGPIIGARESEISLVGGGIVMHTPQTDPVAVITASSEVVTGMPATLDGSASISVSGESLSYQWNLYVKPIDSQTEISNPLEVSTYMIPDLPGEYIVQLVVDDGIQTSDTAQKEIFASEPVEGADVILEITDDPDPVVRKQTLRYIMTILNQGQNAAQDLVLTGFYTGEVRSTPTIIPADACFISAPNFTCTFDELGALEQIQVELSVVPKVDGEFSAYAAVSSPTPEVILDEDDEVTEVRKR